MKYHGFATGYLFRFGLSWDQIVDSYLEIGATAIELSLSSLEKLQHFQPSEQLINKLARFPSLTIHGPALEDFIDENAIRELARISRIVKAKIIVIHPDKVRDFFVLEKFGLPIAIENMDIHKTNFRTVKDLEEIKNNFNFKFVLDTQHVYENDPTMKLGEELLELYGDRLSHLHVSGQTKERKHAMVHCAENKKEIVRILKKNLGVNMIAEGWFDDDFPACAKRELEFLEKY